MNVTIIGAGAFGTALAIALARDGVPVRLICRDPELAKLMQSSRKTGPRLPGHELPETVTVSSNVTDEKDQLFLLAVPMAKLQQTAAGLPESTYPLIGCCKGIDQTTGLGPTGILQKAQSDKTHAVLTGPSFADDIAKGLPTALILAHPDETLAAELQKALSRSLLRVYRTTDVSGAELGGALKNVVALAAGMTIGAGFGDSARASIIARGFAEMQRFADANGARPDTLTGLSGLGDLVLTCTSEKSRNFRAGYAIGKGNAPDQTTTEGLATAGAVIEVAQKLGLELPVFQAVALVVKGAWTVDEAMTHLMARPVGKET